MIKIATSPEESCNTWKDYFQDIFSPKKLDYFDNDFYEKIKRNVAYLKNSNGAENITDIENEIKLKELQTQVKTLKHGKAPGNNFISSEHIISWR